MIPNDIKEIKDQVKHLLFYQVETIKDDFENLEENYQKLNLDFKDKNRNLEFLIRDFRNLSEEMKCLKIYLDNRRNELKNQFNKQTNSNNILLHGDSTNLTSGYNSNSDESNENTFNQNYDKNIYENRLINNELNKDEFNSLNDIDKNDLLINFKSLVNCYVQSLIDYNQSKLTKFKQDVLKIETDDNCFNLINLVNSLNGDDLNDKIKNFFNYKHKLEEHLDKLKIQLNNEKERTKQLNQKSPIDLNNLNKLNLEKLNLNKIDDTEEESNKNILELKFAILKLEDNLNNLKKLQFNLDKEINRYSNEKDVIESRIDYLNNDKRKLLRELRDADSRIKELTSEIKHNQKIIEQLKKK